MKFNMPPPARLALVPSPKTLAAFGAALPLLAVSAYGQDLEGSQGPSRGTFLAQQPTFEAGSSALPDQPLSFLENVGQWGSTARFAARKGPVTIGVELDALVVSVEREAGLSTTRFQFEGARSDVGLEPLDALPSRINMYSGNDPARWATGLVPHERLAYRGLYDGVDLLLRTQGGQLEYDVLLQPGADLDQFSVRCHGVDSLELDEDGGLLLLTNGETLRQSAPVTWSVGADGSHEPLECRFVLLGDLRYGFALSDRPDGQSVVIDPGLEWATFIGGTGDDDIYAMEKDSQGRLVASGHSASTGWALPGGTLNTAGDRDVFVMTFDPSLPAAQQVVWWTYFGGNSTEIGWDLKVNAAGDVFVTGGTLSTDFPTTANGLDSVRSGNSDGFVARLQAGTGTLLYSSYVGGNSIDITQQILLQEPAIVTLAGGTSSSDLPVTPNAYDPVRGGSRDIFISVFDLDQSGASSLQYMSYMGGSGIDGWINERQVDMAYTASGQLAIAGTAQSLDFVGGTTPSFGPTNNGGQDAFVALLDIGVAGPTALNYLTYVGTPGGDGVATLGIGPSGAIWVTGFTYDSSFPTTTGAAFRTWLGPAGFNDAWLVKIDPTLPPADQLLYSTLIPGSEGWDGTWQMKIDGNGTAFISGWTGDGAGTVGGMPVTCGAFDKSFGGLVDGYVMAITPNGTGIDDLHYLSYLGGSGRDFGSALLLEPGPGNPTVTMAVSTTSADNPVTPGAFQPAIGGGFDASILRLRLNPYLTCVSSPNSASPTGARICATGSVSLLDNALDLVVTDLPPNRFGFFLMSTIEVPAFALPAPSQGSLCLGTPIVRFLGSLQSSGTQGQVAFRPNLNNIPQPGPTLAVGDTAVFQFWYRDQGADSGTSNGVAVTLE